MAYYEGTVSASNLYSELLSKITAVQPGETSAWWTNESSVASDGVITSTGSSGTDRIVLVLREGTVGNKLQYSIAENYTPGASGSAGTFSNLYTVKDLIYYTTAQAAANVSYKLNITKDRIILVVEGDPLVSGNLKSLLWFGMPTRFSTESDSSAVLCAASCGVATTNTCVVVKNKAGLYNQNYNIYAIGQAPTNPGWGNLYHMAPVYFGTATEGYRGKLDGLYVLPNVNLLHNDELTIGTDTYKVVITGTSGNNSFPTPCFAVAKF